MISPYITSQGILMKYLLLTLLSIHTLHAKNTAEVTIHSSSIYLIMLFLLLALIVTYAFFVHKCDKKQKLLKEKDANIATFEKQERKNETASLKKDKEIEKEILTLQHTIADLERNIQEGTKNQVVAKIEALQKKRQNTSHS